MHPAAHLTIIRSQDQHHFWLDVPLIPLGVSRQTLQAPIVRTFAQLIDPEVHAQLKNAIDAAAETLRTLQRTPHHSTADERLRTLGGLLFSLVLPTPLQESLRRLLDNLPLILTSHDTQLPWELLHDGSQFLILQRPVARRLFGTQPFRPMSDAHSSQRQVLFIVNPTDDLADAESEGERLLDLYATTPEDWRPSLLTRGRATCSAVRECLADPSYGVIHYSGHARPGALCLADGDMTADEVRRAMRGNPFVFLNGCSSAEREEDADGVADALKDIFGQPADSLAQAFLEGGAVGVVGTIWKVVDTGSRQFSEWFHSAVLKGAPVGDALLQARQQLYAARPRDPLWASYLLYADPTLRIAGLDRRQTRPVTILALRLTGLAQFYAAHTLEQAADIEIQIRDRVALIARRYGGELGDPLAEHSTVRFGLHASHEDNADRAIHTAFDLLRTIADLQADINRPGSRFSIALAAHVGICSGNAIVRDVEEKTVSAQILGDVVDRAIRLTQQTPAQVLWVDAATRRLARAAFAVETVAETHPDGTSAPTFYMVGPQQVDKQGHVSFVGRSVEMAFLAARWQEAVAGRGQLVELVGEAGIGKSRLVAAFQQERVEDALWLRAACYSYHSSSAYSLLAPLVRGLAGIDEKGTNEDAAAALTALLEGMGARAIPPSADQRQEELALLGQVVGYTFPAPSLETVKPDHLLRRRAGLVQGMLEAAAAQQPILLVLEDLQWIDEASLAILDQLISALRRMPILLLCVYRPEWNPPWGLLPHRHQQLLGELAQSEQGQLLAGLLNTDTVPPGLEQKILARTRGNPFFLEEAVRHLQEADALVQEGDVWLLVNEAALADLPDTVESLIRSRLEKVQSEHRPALDQAAVVGEIFEHKILDELADAASKAVLDPALEELTEQALIDEQKGHWPDLEYSFHHGLIHQTVYEGLLTEARRRMHTLVARLLSRLYGDNVEQLSAEQLDMLAEHYYRSDDHVQAIRYALRVGHRDQNRYAGNALIWYGRALERLSAFATEATTQDEQILRWQVEALRGRADLQNRVGMNDEALADYEQALTLAQKAGFDGEGQADLHLRIGRTFDSMGQSDQVQAALDRGLAVLAEQECPEMGKLWVWTGLVHFRQGRLAEGLAACESGIALLNRFDAPADLAQAYNLLGLLRRHLGHREQALDAYSRSLAVYREVDDLMGQTRVRNNRGSLYQDMGRWDEALVDFETGTELAGRTGEVWWQAGGPLNQGEIHRRRGNFDKAIALNRTALAMGEEFEQAEIQGLANMNLGATYLKQGSLREAEQHLTAAENIFREGKANGNLSELLGYRAELCIGQGNLAGARTLAEEALSIASKLNRTMQQGYAHRVLSKQCRLQGEYAEAEKHLEQSLAFFADSPYEQGITYFERARLRIECFGADNSDAIADCKQAILFFARVAAQLDLAEARALLAEEKG